MQQRLRMPTRTQRAGRAAAAALTAPSSHDRLDYTMVGRVPVSDGEPMLLMTETKNEISTSTDGAVCFCVLTGYQRAQVLN